ncbi:quinone-dependent dihydroorotate dehydrogenase [Brevifollis gellanilyticus]|uniref:Dihydroorotate dehydrogenase (quinone) n=1 Tax=Brevifollis gellanilyticus TaxID=748831 RepID=A0A512MB63_9BACT|nr:quinone-dependent dihydroorotate dehydrogenase [Brevifollis gellanilyticus]GEP43972.1 dihydroorotate dehydrogenase (quinone) [Brevifollis gellanilyticus]
MSLVSALYPALKPWLFKLDAERAHEWTTKMMRISHSLGMLKPDELPASKPVDCLGLRFPNALGLAAGMDKSASAVEAWAALGFGFVEVGTLTPRPQPGNPKPRLFRLPEHEALINRMGFNNVGIHAAVKKLEKRKTSAIVGVNIGKNFDTPNEQAVNDYLYCLKAAYPVADYIAVNISSPNTKGLRDLQAEDSIRQLLAALKKEQASLEKEYGKKKPVLVKIAPDLEGQQIEALARVFNELAVDGVIATNTTISREAVAGHPLEKEAGGLSGAPVTERSTLVIEAFRMLLREQTPIIGVGGILSGADAVAKLKAGASLVQVYSGLVYRGPGLIADVLRGISAHS